MSLCFQQRRGYDRCLSGEGRWPALSGGGCSRRSEKIPRNFAIDPSGKWLLAGGQNSDTVAVHRIDLRKQGN
ncbi:MAG: beta-propeller fold lactonase family protein [Blautia sp.]